MEDFTSKKTQIVSGAPVIKKVFRMREGGVVVTSFDTKKGDDSIHYGIIPAGTLLVIDPLGVISPCPMRSDGVWLLDIKNAYPIGFTTNDVTPEKPQTAVMTWGVINFDAYQSEFGRPIEYASSDLNFYGILLYCGIVVTNESDVLYRPAGSPLPSNVSGTN